MRSAIPAWRIFCFARTSLWPIVAGETRNADAICAASSPSTVCSIKGARMPASIAGCAGEHQSQPVVGNSCFLLRGFKSFAHALQLLGCCFAATAPTRHVEKLAPRHSQQPRFRISRAGLLRPIGEGRCESFRKRVLGRRHVARAGSQKRDELAVTAARRCIRRCVSLRAAVVVLHRYIAHMGRTSTVPWPAPGQRAAQLMAASRSGTSIRKYPPSCSFDSINGPSRTLGFPSTTRTRVDDELGPSRPDALRAPALVSASAYAM